MPSELLTETVWYPPDGCELAWVNRAETERGLTRWLTGAWVPVFGPVAATCNGCGAFVHLCWCAS